MYLIKTIIKSNLNLIHPVIWQRCDVSGDVPASGERLLPHQGQVWTGQTFGHQDLPCWTHCEFLFLFCFFVLQNFVIIIYAFMIMNTYFIQILKSARNEVNTYWDVRKLGGMWATECLNSRIPLPNLPYTRHSVNLKKIIDNSELDYKRKT